MAIFEWVETCSISSEIVQCVGCKVYGASLCKLYFYCLMVIDCVVILEILDV